MAMWTGIRDNQGSVLPVSTVYVCVCVCMCVCVCIYIYIKLQNRMFN